LQIGLVHIVVEKIGTRTKFVVGVETVHHINSLHMKISSKKAMILLACLIAGLCLIPIARKINSFYRQKFEVHFYKYEPGYVPEPEDESE